MRLNQAITSRPPGVTELPHMAESCIGSYAIDRIVVASKGIVAQKWICRQATGEILPGVVRVILSSARNVRATFCSALQPPTEGSEGRCSRY